MSYASFWFLPISAPKLQLHYYTPGQTWELTLFLWGNNNKSAKSVQTGSKDPNRHVRNANKLHFFQTKILGPYDVYTTWKGRILISKLLTMNVAFSFFFRNIKIKINKLGLSFAKLSSSWGRLCLLDFPFEQASTGLVFISGMTNVYCTSPITVTRLVLLFFSHFGRALEERKLRLT